MWACSIITVESAESELLVADALIIFSAMSSANAPAGSARNPGALTSHLTVSKDLSAYTLGSILTVLIIE